MDFKNETVKISVESLSEQRVKSTLSTVYDALKEKGYNTNKIRTEGLLSQSTLQKFRNKQGVSWENLETLCRLLECQPADLIEFVADEGVQ